MGGTKIKYIKIDSFDFCWDSCCSSNPYQSQKQNTSIELLMVMSKMGLIATTLRSPPALHPEIQQLKTRRILNASLVFKCKVIEYLS